MMKATAWFCPVLLTLLCATRLVCTAQRGAGTGGAAGGAGGAGAEAAGSGRTNGYPLDYPDSRNIQDDFLLQAKRNKPSLSIVNPLDVLRQRLLLEIARRQMKENSRQVELNRAILKNVGKRVLMRGGAPKVTRRYREREREWQREPVDEQPEQERQQLVLPWKHFPSQFWSYGWAQSQNQVPSSQFADSLQLLPIRPQSLPGQKAEAAAQQLLSYAKKSLNVAGIGMAQRMVRQRGNGNEAANETTDDVHGYGYGYGSGSSKNAARYVDEDDEEENNNNIEGDVEEGLDTNWGNDEPNEVVVVPPVSAGVANANERLPWNFPYRFHKSQHNVN
ncbi:hypothetical protein KR009_002778 [Drosophila setifemur]|nr:hypothetical protein KR009_002778 [Drosophila setifemur]